MDHHYIEKEIAHLERVITLISAADRIPLSYWRARIKEIGTARLVAAQHRRWCRLQEKLRQLEALHAHGAADTGPPLRREATG
ncbi:hypothetical protein [Paraburkholderia sp. BL10I2N1]|uniref:hypothetical protein n=1 Tax=Paraburkholderia sp. BL10I2N1 TaxID=1938796 RepID=UPI00105C9C41|nr:hypothetical protein [Paraburkholderia sp. BL10I2N1]TDN61833.1 hypothetical protein B0G77_5332 [Paraburkholderia sp. BL10I2N1]